MDANEEAEFARALVEPTVERKPTRVEILEDRIRYAIAMIQGGYVGEAMMELDRALHDPDMNPDLQNADEST